MATATNTRRAMLAAVAAAPVAPLPPVSVATEMPSPDAELLRLGALLDEAWRKENEAYAAAEARVLGADEAAEEACDRSGEIAGRILARRATTWEGLRVKAKALSWCHLGAVELNELDLACRQRTTDNRLARSILEDLLADTGEPTP